MATGGRQAGDIIGLALNCCGGIIEVAILCGGDLAAAAFVRCNSCGGTLLRLHGIFFGLKIRVRPRSVWTRVFDRGPEKRGRYFGDFSACTTPLPPLSRSYHVGPGRARLDYRCRL